jgi:exopolysaccharide production protein ExoZ
MANKQTIQSIQILRAVAAWLVVAHHFGRELSSPFSNVFAQHGNFGVDCFFVISGFIIFVVARDGRSAREFISNRLFRIVPAYWLATLALLVCVASFPEEFDYTGWTWRTLAASLAFVPVENPTGLGPFPPLVVGWTLNIEMFFYALLALCFVFGRRRFLVCAGVLLLAPVLWHRDWNYGAVLGTRKLYEFVLGIGLGWVYVSPPSLWRRLTASWRVEAPWVGLALLVFAGGLLYLDRDGARLLAAGAVVSAGLCLEPWLSRESRVVKAFVRLGEVSYSTYLWHYLVVSILIHYLGRPTSLVHEVVEWLALVLVVNGVSRLSYVWIERSAGIARLHASTEALLAAESPESVTWR